MLYTIARQSQANQIKFKTVQAVYPWTPTYIYIRHRAAACGGTGGVSLRLVRSAGLLVLFL